MAAASVTVPSVLQASSFCSGIESRSSRKDAATSAVSFSARTAYTSLSSLCPSVFHPRISSCCSKFRTKSTRNVVRAAVLSEEEIRQVCLQQFGARKALKVEIGNYDGFYKSGRVFSPEEVLGLTKRTKKLLPDVVQSVTVPHTLPLDEQEIPDGSVSVILLAGGKGKRMGANMPKQYLPLLGQPIALHSFHTFSVMAVVGEIIVVCDPSYRDVFEDENISTPVKFCCSWERTTRFSVEWSAAPYDLTFQEISKTAKLVCIHDSARPLVQTSDILKVISDAWVHGAAVLGVPCKATIKEAGRDQFVKKTLDRRTLWEMQTPQVIEPELLRKGFELVERERLEVTDDVSIVEYLKHPVLITEGCYTNLKVTTPDDLHVAERILHERSNSIASGSALPVVNCI
ncbi:hypothetical protein R1sor_008773 [Riccia sorocarpa]|uniref:2-C-methyl-D-erythritol 4-phosphate cytidylyltransferase, chloroplastic n=1 Tax=Riccia sorocarpa TaxID=122646 RepID=A0ABD3HX59_9MARC